MRLAHLAAPAAALVVLALPGTADAATISQQFAADSGDACHYGSTSGTLGWTYGTTSPLPAGPVDVKGRLTDRPLPGDPGSACPSDGYAGTATFTAYAGSTVVDRQSRSADNAAVSFEFLLGKPATTTGIDRIVIQVCRGPVLTLPPSYCGPAVTYLAPPTA
ncbi:hypothetical protein [Streptomyces sp. NPDC002671]